MPCDLHFMAVSAPTRLIGESAATQKIRDVVKRVAKTRLPVLIVGATGTGKEVVARMVHEQSGLAGPYVAVDCAAVAENLIEAELFGSEKGAFTGASASRRGLVANAGGGTFFLDELGELSASAQTRLLRLLEQGTYRPLGGQTEHTADIRVVAATWRPLRDWVDEGQFRLDLYHRLSVIEISIPPLRDRPEDILPLVQHFSQEIAAQLNREPPRFDRRAEEWLLAHAWPGNVRELRNLVQYFCALFPGRKVGLTDLPERYHSSPSPLVAVQEVRTDLPYKEARRIYLDAFQSAYVRTLLDAHSGNVSKAARVAGMDRRSIQRIVKRIQAESQDT